MLQHRGLCSDVHRGLQSAPVMSARRGRDWEGVAGMMLCEGCYCGLAGEWRWWMRL